MKVVGLRPGPTVDNIPAMMRQLADRIESGEQPADAVLCIIPQPGDWPAIFGWGDHQGDLGNIGLCELAKAWFVQNNTVR